uniref:Uncharacterized protein n=1 Tax=Avena sativa TaxID=4498 RepID=A0ACD5Y6D9_AVESA
MALFPVYPLFLALLVVILLLCYLNRLARGAASLRLPPGPWALPVIGHAHHLLGKLPQHKLRDLAQRHGPVMLLRVGELPVVVASSADAAREIMKTQDLAFATRHITRTMRLVLVQGSEGFLLAPYGEDWRQLRKIVTVELLSARRVQSFRAFREQEVRQLLLAVQPGGRAVNLSKLISSYIADSMARAIIGSRFKDRESFFRLLEQGLKLFSRPSLPDLFPSSRLAMLVSRRPRRVKQLSSSTLAFIERIIQEHQAHKVDAGEEEDMVDVLLRVQREGRLHSTVNIKAVIAELFMAGSDTSSTTLQWAMSELVKNQRVMQKAQREVRQVLEGQESVTEDRSSKLHYLHLVIKETLRLHPPAPLLMPRECRGGPRRVLGFDVPDGAMVLINTWAIGRDPSVWDDAEKFMPERFEGNMVDFKGTNFEYTPFGAGRRMCPGMAFGLANIELALASLLYHFDWECPAGKEATDLDMAEARIARRRSDLVLVPVVRVCVPPM